MNDIQVQTSQEQLRRHHSALADFGLFAFQCDDIDSLLQRAVELVSEAMGIPLVKVLEHIPDRGEMFFRSGVNWDSGVVGRETFADHEGSPAGYALRTEHPVVSPDVDEEDRFEIPAVLRRHNVKSMVNVIIAGESAAFGVLEVDAREKRDFYEDDIVFLRNYANLIAAAIERLRVHEELRRSAREQNVLAHEMGHRVKNLLGVIQALASQTFTENRTAEEFRAAFIERLQALSVAENLAFDSGSEHADLMTLAEKILAPYLQRDRANIEIKGSFTRLSARRARMFGLALHELATNAAKHGALSVTTGRVRLDWQVNEADEGAFVSVNWQEFDGPEITPPDRKGFGTRLLKYAVAHELEGNADLVYAREGLRYCLKFPVKEK
ncbi:sensor histidine kinase [Yoonia sp.]|uniref:sensor histidine kinase n=1 Tax=Yoonia sp. TaxID=2212373 RepID=UPI00391DEE8B